MSHIPLNGSAVTNKVRRGLTGHTACAATAASTLGAALRGETAQREGTIDGTGFGLSPSHKPTKAPATDPSQGRGNRRPRVTDDPIMQAFQHMGLA